MNIIQQNAPQNKIKDGQHIYLACKYLAWHEYSQTIKTFLFPTR